MKSGKPFGYRRAIRVPGLKRMCCKLRGTPIKAVLPVFVSMLATITTSVRSPCLSGPPSLPRIRTLRRLLSTQGSAEGVAVGLSAGVAAVGGGGSGAVGAGDAPLSGEQAASPLATTVRATEAAVRFMTLGRTSASFSSHLFGYRWP